MWSTTLSALWLGAASLVVAATNEDGVKSIPLRTHSLSQPYLDSDMQSRWYDFGGHTIIRTDQYIRLASDRHSQSGWLFSRVPLTATNWEIEVEFKIHGKNQLYGDGMAMWLTKERAKPGPVFGHTDEFDGLGVIIDTYKNNRPGVVFPYVMALTGDGKTKYDKDADGKANEFAACSARGIRGASIPTKLRLTYFQDKSLKLELQYKSEGEWTLCFESDKPPAIPQVSYLGFSAETGELSDNHDIISINVNNLYQSRTDGKPSSNPKKASKAWTGNSGEAKSGGSWFWFFMKILFFFILVGSAYIGYTAWRTNQNKRSHRF